MIHAVNELSIDGAVSNWSGQRSTNRAKRRARLVFGEVVIQQLMRTSTDQPLMKRIGDGFAVRLFEADFSSRFPFWSAARWFCSVFGHNDATVIPEKVSLGGLDVIVSIVRLLMQSF